MTDSEPPVLALEYAELPAPPRPRWPAKLSLGLSLVSPACLLVSVAMYQFRLWRDFQVMLAWTSIVVGALALVAAIIVMIRNPRGGREITALAAAVVHAALVLAVLKYYG
jgi:hypothetical protein